MLCAQNLVGGQQQLSSVSVRFNQGLSNQVQWWALFKLAAPLQDRWRFYHPKKKLFWYCVLSNLLSFFQLLDLISKMMVRFMFSSSSLCSSLFPFQSSEFGSRSISSRLAQVV